MLSTVKPVTASSKVMVTVTSLSLLLVTGLGVTVMVALGGLLSMVYVARLTLPVPGLPATSVMPVMLMPICRFFASVLAARLAGALSSTSQDLPPAVGGARVLQRAHARRYRQVSRRETGLIQLLGKDKGDGGYLVGAGQVGVADRRGAREGGRPGVDDEDGAGGVVGGAGSVVCDGALGSVQVRGRREDALIDLGGGGTEGLDVSEVVAAGYGAASDGRVTDVPIEGAHE